MATLLEQARARPSNRRKPQSEVTPEQVEVAVAWARDQLSLSQAAYVAGLTVSAQLYVWLAMRLRAHVQSTAQS